MQIDQKFEANPSFDDLAGLDPPEKRVIYAALGSCILPVENISVQATLHNAPPYEVGDDIVVDGEYILQYDPAKAIAAYLERNFAKDCTRRCKDKWFDVRCFWLNLKLKGWTDKHCIDIAFEPGIQYPGRYASTKHPCINPDVIAFPLSHFRDKYKEHCAQKALDFHFPSEGILRGIGTDNTQQ